MKKNKQKIKVKPVKAGLVLTQAKGITLIALIITIIVMLILAAIVIRAVQGDGIITKAKDAEERYSAAEEKEKIQLALNEWKLQKNYPTFYAFMKGKFPNADITENDDGSVNIKMTDEYIVKEDGPITEITGRQYYVIGKPGDSEVFVYYITNAYAKVYALNSEEGRFDLGGQAEIGLKSNPAALTITVGETPVTITTSDTAIFFREKDDQTGEILEGLGGYIKDDVLYLGVEDGDSISSTSDRILKLDPDFSFEKYLPTVADNFYNVKYELIVTSSGTSGVTQIPIDFYFYENGKYIINYSGYYLIKEYTKSNDVINLPSILPFGSISVSKNIEIKNKSILYAYVNNTKTKLTRIEEEFTYSPAEPAQEATFKLWTNAIYKSNDGYYLHTFNEFVTGQIPGDEHELYMIDSFDDITTMEGLTISDNGNVVSGVNYEGFRDKTFTLVENIDDIIK